MCGGNDANTILIHKNNEIDVKVLRIQGELFSAAVSFFHMVNHVYCGIIHNK